MWDYLDGVALHMATVATRKRRQAGLRPGWRGQQSCVCAGGTGEGDGAAGARGARRLGSQAPRHGWDLSPPADRHQPPSHWSLPALGSWTPWFSRSASLCLPPLPSLSASGPPRVSAAVPLFVPVLCPVRRVSLSICPPPHGWLLCFIVLIPSRLASFPRSRLSLPLCLFASVSLSSSTFLSLPASRLALGVSPAGFLPSVSSTHPVSASTSPVT